MFHIRNKKPEYFKLSVSESFNSNNTTFNQNPHKKNKLDVDSVTSVESVTTENIDDDDETNNSKYISPVKITPRKTPTKTKTEFLDNILEDVHASAGISSDEDENKSNTVSEIRYNLRSRKVFL
jgi:hypothetical protein